VLSIACSTENHGWVEITWLSGSAFTLYWTADIPGGSQSWDPVDGPGVADVTDNGDGTWTWTDKGADPEMGGQAPGDVEKRLYRVRVE